MSVTQQIEILDSFITFCGIELTFIRAHFQKKNAIHPLGIFYSYYALRTRAMPVHHPCVLWTFHATTSSRLGCHGLLVGHLILRI